MAGEQNKKHHRKFPLLPQKLMYELLHLLHINIVNIPEEGYYFQLIPNLKHIFKEAGYGPGLVERVKNLDFYGEDSLKTLLSDIDQLQNFVNPRR